MWNTYGAYVRSMILRGIRREKGRHVRELHGEREQGEREAVYLLQKLFAFVVGVSRGEQIHLKHVNLPGKRGRAKRESEGLMRRGKGPKYNNSRSLPGQAQWWSP